MHTFSAASSFLQQFTFQAKRPVLVWLCLCMLFLSAVSNAQEKRQPTPDASDRRAASDATLPSTRVLIAPLNSHYVYLIDASGEILHEWKFEVTGSNAYLFPDGALMRASQEPEIDLFDGRGSAGRIQKVDWDGNLLWDFKYASPSYLQHHDFEVLPNGNVMFIAWEKLTRAEALAAGRDPDKLTADELYSEKIVEVRPQGLTGGEPVWEWRLWDHLIQNFDSSKPNFGQPQDNPRRVDINYAKTDRADWIHMNAVDYHPEFDQIILSPRYNDELWVVDHSTTTAEAATSTGGRQNHGGDLLYRMGNPMAYGKGTLEDKLLFGQHNCMWIPPGYPGAGDVTVFNNGTSPPREPYSSVEQFRLPVNDSGVYRMQADGSFEAPEVVWSYSRGPELFSVRISGAERLANGNTLICSGDQPWILEVTPDKQVVWETRHRYFGPGEDKLKGFENGCMFRAPGYAADFLQLPVTR